MKTIRINKHIELEVTDECLMYEVKIDNKTKKVIYHSSEFGPITLEEIQTLVDKLLRLKMITLFGESITEVHINVWDIGDNNINIETYHMDHNLPDNQLLDEYDRTMNYNNFKDM